jgi:hypothetical protein
LAPLVPSLSPELGDACPVRLQDDHAFNVNLKQIGMLALKYKLPMTAGENEMGALFACRQADSMIWR